MKTEIIKGVGGAQATISAVFTAAMAFVNKVPTLLLLFIIAVIIDYITGWIKAAVFLNEWDSKTGARGAVKKLMYFVMIGVAFLIGYGLSEMGDRIGFDLSFTMYIGWYVVTIMLINEFTSILENLYVIMPDKVPAWLIKMLKISDETLNNKINDIVCKNQNCSTCDLSARCNMKKEDKGQ